jgi:hypothetical protein
VIGLFIFSIHRFDPSSRAFRNSSTKNLIAPASLFGPYATDYLSTFWIIAQVLIGSSLIYLALL